jgi:hypothetical protein
MNFGAGDAVPTTTALPSSDATTPVAEDPVVIGPAAIATVTAFDPEGDLLENDGDAVLALADANPGTSWPTSCYSSQYMGGKTGVGLVVTFDDLAQQAITVDAQNGPYQIDFFASGADTIPATIGEWGAPLASTAFDAEPATVTSPIPPAPARHMLILLKELGRDSTCSDANPYRGRLGEIAVVG